MINPVTIDERCEEPVNSIARVGDKCAIFFMMPKPRIPTFSDGVASNYLGYSPTVLRSLPPCTTNNIFLGDLLWTTF